MALTMTDPGDKAAAPLPRLRRYLGALWAAVLAGALAGALWGGIGGRVVMRAIALIDESTEGSQTDFATVGEFTVGGTFTLLVLTMIAGVIGGAIYLALRRWLPRNRGMRGIYFGMLMMFGPGLIAVSEVDLQIFEPALPIFAMFVFLIVAYGVTVALATDHLHPAPPVRASHRVDNAHRVALWMVAVGIGAIAVFATQNVHAHAGTCLRAGDAGGCAVPATK
jgi:hypothetical protein